MRILLFVLVAVVIAAAACSSSSDAVPAPSAGDASVGADASLCATVDGGSMRCHSGDACNCNDVGFTGPMCVGGQWKCAPGTTRAEDCYGVPPVRPCTLDEAGVAHGAPADAGDGG